MMHDGFRLALLNPWQHDFPLVRDPYGVIARALSVDPEVVLAGYRRLLADGSLSRIGAVFAAGAGGAGPPGRRRGRHRLGPPGREPQLPA